MPWTHLRQIFHIKSVFILPICIYRYHAINIYAMPKYNMLADRKLKNMNITKRCNERKLYLQSIHNVGLLYDFLESYVSTKIVQLLIRLDA